MKKLFLMLLLLVGSLVYSYEEKKLNFYGRCRYLRENEKVGEYSIISVDDIDYIKIEDLMKLLQELYLKTEIEINENEAILKKDGFEIKIDKKNNIVKRYDVNVENLEGILYYNGLGQIFDNTNILELKDYLVEIVDEEYFPVFLIGKAFFENYIQVYKNPEERYYIFDKEYLQNEKFIGSYSNKKVIEPLKAKGKLNKKSGEIILNYYIKTIEDVYPGAYKYDLNELENKYLNKLEKVKFKYQFNYLLRDFMREFKDDHMGSRTLGGLQLPSNNDEIGKGNRNIFEIKEINENTTYIYLRNFINAFFYDGKYIEEYLDLIENKKNIIIDLRGNTGGYIGTVKWYISKIINNKINVFLKNRSKVSSFELTGEATEKKNFVLIVNRGSYSASNLFAALVKMNNMGTVIGEKTGGGFYRGAAAYVMVDNNVINIPDQAFGVDEKGNDFEDGVEPDIYVETDIIDGRDFCLEKALEILGDKERAIDN